MEHFSTTLPQFSSSYPLMRKNSLSYRRSMLTMCIWNIAAGLSGIAFLFGLCGFGYHRAGTVFMTLVSALAFLTTLVVWIIEMVLFGVARDHIRGRGDIANYGNANWLVLGAFVSLLFAFLVSACGIFGSYRKRSY